MKNLMKPNCLFFFKQLKIKTPANSISIFKIFLSRIERSVTYEASLNYSPRTKLQLETTTRETDLTKTHVFEVSPIPISKINDTSSNCIDSELESLDFQNNSKIISNKLEDKKIFEQLLEQNFDNIRKLVRSKQFYGNTNSIQDSINNNKQQSNRKIGLMIKFIKKNHFYVIHESIKK